MEATGVYWKPVYYALEGLFEELWLCNAHHVQNVPGRKTDLSDAEWLADVAAHGMVRPSLVPPPEIRELRELTRYRKTQVDMRTQQIQRLEKVLQDAGIKLSSVASGVWSKSARDMIEAMISGERDPVVLAQMARSRMRTKIPQLEEALSGHFGYHHAVVCRKVIDHIDHLDGAIADLTSEITRRLVPFEAAVILLCSITGSVSANGPGNDRRDGSRHVTVPDAWPSRRLGWRRTSQLRVGRQASARRDTQRRNLASTSAHRSRQSSRSHEGQLLQRPIRSNRPPARTEQGRGRGRELDTRRLPGISSPRARSTSIPVPTTSTPATIRPLRRSGSSVGSRHSASASRSQTRPRNSRLLPTHVWDTTRASSRAPYVVAGIGHFIPAGSGGLI